METRELMHGDIVRVKLGIGKVVGFKYNSEGNELVVVKNPGWISVCSPELVEPVRLTEETLKANGFKESSMGLVLFPRGRFGEDGGEIVDFINVLLRKDKTIRGIEISVFHYHFQCNYSIHSIHELQRALRCCGLWDLADNFKTE